MDCPSCGTGDQTGNFCAECGAALKAACGACGAPAETGARFCTQCGQRLAAATGAPARTGFRGPGRAGYVIAAIALVVVLLIFMLPRRADRAGAPAMSAPAGEMAERATGDGPGPLSGDMRTNADRLFNRIMEAHAAGERAEVERFVPMAVQAYGMVDDLDADGVYHLAILHLTAGDHGAAIETAERILGDAPDHVLALGVAGEAAAAAGDTARARAYYRRLLDAYPEEAARQRPEYVDHAAMLPRYRAAARELVDPT